MSLARERQLEFEDVWSLPYEFQHRKLHDNFRSLRGTVIRRLLQANGIDLLLIVFISMINQLTQFAAPVFLQLILKSMRDEDVSQNVALKYAVLALIGRLINTQSGVFQLWFGRRCYERSRGEMITMLYEKTLGRQISIQAPDAKQKKTADNGSTNGHANSDEPSKSRSWWSRLTTSVKTPPPAKEPASMGKILNLMRNDVYEVAQRFWEFDALIQKPS
jgi:ABC-type multidrug transport system fused ATPase/permease subunit